MEVRAVDDFSVKGSFTEAQLEAAIIELFRRQGYTYVRGDTIHRKPEDILLTDDLRTYISGRYAAESLSEVETQAIINRLNFISVTPIYAGNREAFRLVNEGFDLVREDASRVALHIDFIDYDNPDANIFKVVNQYEVKDAELRRPDMLVFINGIPVAIWEFKSAISEEATIHDAWEQITIRYARGIPKLLRTCFLAVICDGANTRMGSVFTAYPYFYAWNRADDGGKAHNGISALFTMVSGAFARDRLLQLLRDFIFYPDDGAEGSTIVCRYPQFFGARKMFANIGAHLQPEGDGKGGTYFGATGCGKTYTMLFLARLLIMRDREHFRNPTIIVLTDREDLNSQTARLFTRARHFLGTEDVRSIESRDDLKTSLRYRPSGGVYITTIQKFCEEIGLLSDRNNIICISDEAHRSQINIGKHLKKTPDGVYTKNGFGYYLRQSFPHATYCGFTGTPIDETLAVFGNVVDSYTMKEASDDGITARIAYEPRLARVMLSEEQAKEIEKYYERCAEQGSTDAQIEESQRAMSKMRILLGNPERIERLAQDIVTHYEALCAEKPNVVQKAMIVCADRALAFRLLKQICSIRSDWAVPRRAEDEAKLTPAQLNALLPLPKINLVATQGQNDEKELFDACGNKAHRKMLDEQFRNDASNFRIAVVVDMWITGFDVPSLAVMYIDKPLQKHTLIQTISRVNRIYEGKDHGLVVDYIGFLNDMKEAIRKYGSPIESPVDELNATLGIFRNHLSLLDDLMVGFDASRFYTGSPLERLYCLNDAAEFVQRGNELQTRFMGLSRRLKSAYEICNPSGELTAQETAKAQFYLAIRSIIWKQTKGDAPDAETMNRVVEQMVQRAISCTGVENIIDDSKQIDLSSEEFLENLKSVKLPITRFNALLKLLRKAITAYGRTNKVKSIEFAERLRQVVDQYNKRDKLVFTNEVVNDFVDNLADQLIQILNDLRDDQTSFEQMGISFEEKAFYDILIKVRDDHGFPYPEEKCIALAKEIKSLVDDKAQYVDWLTRSDIKNQMSMDLTVLLYNNGYPPDWDDEVFQKVLEQAENFRKNSR